MATLIAVGCKPSPKVEPKAAPLFQPMDDPRSDRPSIDQERQHAIPDSVPVRPTTIQLPGNPSRQARLASYRAMANSASDIRSTRAMTRLGRMHVHGLGVE